MAACLQILCTEQPKADIQYSVFRLYNLSTKAPSNSKINAINSRNDIICITDVVLVFSKIILFSCKVHFKENVLGEILRLLFSQKLENEGFSGDITGKTA